MAFHTEKPPIYKLCKLGHFIFMFWFSVYEVELVDLLYGKIEGKIVYQVGQIAFLGQMPKSTIYL